MSRTQSTNGASRQPLVRVQGRPSLSGAWVLREYSNGDIYEEIQVERRIPEACGRVSVPNESVEKDPGPAENDLEEPGGPGEQDDAPQPAASGQKRRPSSTAQKDSAAKRKKPVPAPQGKMKPPPKEKKLAKEKVEQFPKRYSDTPAVPGTPEIDDDLKEMGQRYRGDLENQTPSDDLSDVDEDLIERVEALRSVPAAKKYGERDPPKNKGAPRKDRPKKVIPPQGDTEDGHVEQDGELGMPAAKPESATADDGSKPRKKSNVHIDPDDQILDDEISKPKAPAKDKKEKKTREPRGKKKQKVSTPSEEDSEGDLPVVDKSKKNDK